MRKVNKDNENVKYAIYNVYGGKCFYTNKPLDYISMQIDHIMPESLATNKKNLMIY